MKRLARTDLAIHSRQLLHQSIWCGVVFGIVVVLTALNALPPVDVQYLVTGKVIASPMRAQALRQTLISPNGTDLGQAQLRQLTLLDEQSNKQPLRIETNQQYYLLGVKSIWQSRCTHDQFYSWIDSIAKSPEPRRVVSSTPTSHDLRVARWEYEAAKHYRAHHEFLSESGTAPSLDPTVQEKGVFQLASSSQPANLQLGLPDPNSTNFTQLKQQLSENVAALQSRLDSLSQQSKAEQSMIAGQVEITDGPKIQPHCLPIPVWMSFSVLILGLAAGLSAGWLQMRLQSGGVYDPQDVAVQLSRTGLPVVAQVQLGSDQIESTDWLALAGQKASNAGRTSGRNLILLSESMLAVWCIIILGRICFDPLWRGLVLDSPLGALGRLLAGMP